MMKFIKNCLNWIHIKHNERKQKQSDFEINNYNPLTSIDSNAIKTANHFRISHQYDRYRYWKLWIILGLLILALILLFDMYCIIHNTAESSYNIMLCTTAKNKDICLFLLDQYNKHYYLKSDVLKYIILFHCSAIAVLGISIKSLFVHQFNNNTVNDEEFSVSNKNFMGNLTDDDGKRLQANDEK